VTSTHSSPTKASVASKKNYEQPSAKSYVPSEDARTFQPPRSTATRSHVSSQYSESSYAPSQSTSRTTPPASQRGPYATTDPNKIVIKAVYLFNDLFPKPVAQLVASVGKVTDGLILKIQSEGLFIDDDVRSIPQREWDVKAWTLKMVEVSFSYTLALANLLTRASRLASRPPNTYTSYEPRSATPTARNTSSSLTSRRAGSSLWDCSASEREARSGACRIAKWRRMRLQGF
jgi:hypothetical protein